MTTKKQPREKIIKQKEKQKNDYLSLTEDDEVETTTIKRKVNKYFFALLNVEFCIPPTNVIYPWGKRGGAPPSPKVFKQFLTKILHRTPSPPPKVAFFFPGGRVRDRPSTT